MNEPRAGFWRARSRCALVAPVLAGAFLAGCATSEPGVAQLPRDVVDQIREVDLSPRLPQRAQPDKRPPLRAEAGQGAVSYYGEGLPKTVAARPSPGVQSPGSEADPATTGALPTGADAGAGEKAYEINFENTPVGTVTKAILGDILGVGYTTDPRVQGTVSLSSGRALPKKDLLYVFESALRANNIALVREGRGYRLVPAAEAVGSGPIDASQGPDAGYGISVVPVKFVSAQTLIKLLDNFAAKPGMVRADPSRNLIVIQGNGADRRAAIDTVLSFDADWMRGQSVGIYPVRNSSLEPIIAELERIVDSGEGGLSQNVVKLQPIGRQNAVLVVTREPEYLRTVSTWITRLDRSGPVGTGVKVYRMRYGDAKQAAALLSEIFTGGSSGSGLDSPTNQLAPGSGVVASSSGRSGSQSALADAQQTPTSGNAQTSSTAAATFDTRFADASGGRLARSSAGGSGRGELGANGPPLLPNVRIVPDTVNNALLIYANQESYRLIERTLQQLDIPQLQVEIDATIAEVTLNDQLNYGVQFFLTSKDVGLRPDSGSIINSLIPGGGAVLNRVLPGFNFLLGTEAQPRVILDALHAVTDVKIVSTPSVVVIDNQVATLQVGDQIPITTRTAQSVDVPTAPVVNNIDYRNTGVILRVVPRVNANGNVLLDVEQEISAVANTSTATSLTPTVSQRKVKSSIAVTSGQTVLLGGLISERKDSGRNGIPGFDQIPTLGDLFSRNSGTQQRTELIIFIRPQIIRGGVDAARAAQELRAKMRGFGPRPPLVGCSIGCPPLVPR